MAPQRQESHLELERRNREPEQRNAALLASLCEAEADLLARRRSHDEREWVVEHAVDPLVISDETGPSSRSALR